ncbi:MAG: hypothetical protein ACNI27_16870 [Desulfovibrio sp.]
MDKIFYSSGLSHKESGDFMQIGARPSTFYTHSTTRLSATDKKEALSKYGEQVTDGHQVQERMLRIAREGGTVRRMRKAGISLGSVGIHYEESSVEVDPQKVAKEEAKRQASAYKEQQEVAGLRNMIAAGAASYAQTNRPAPENTPAMRAKALSAYNNVARNSSSGYTSQVPNMIRTVV